MNVLAARQEIQIMEDDIQEKEALNTWWKRVPKYFYWNYTLSEVGYFLRLLEVIFRKVFFTFTWVEFKQGKDTFTSILQYNFLYTSGNKHDYLNHLLL